MNRVAYTTETADKARIGIARVARANRAKSSQRDPNAMIPTKVQIIRKAWEFHHDPKFSGLTRADVAHAIRAFALEPTTERINAVLSPSLYWY